MVKIQKANRDLQQMQYTVQKIVCPQDMLHTELFPNIEKKT